MPRPCWLGAMQICFSHRQSSDMARATMPAGSPSHSITSNSCSRKRLSCRRRSSPSSHPNAAALTPKANSESSAFAGLSTSRRSESPPRRRGPSTRHMGSTGTTNPAIAARAVATPHRSLTTPKTRGETAPAPIPRV